MNANLVDQFFIAKYCGACALAVLLVLAMMVAVSLVVPYGIVAIQT